jgi:bifunctional non-homologous end joining protein LigD
VRQFVIDGEVVAIKGRLTSFATLQLRMQVEHPSPELRQKIPVWYYAFDLVNLNGYDIRHLRLRDRKTLLKQAFDFEGRLRFTEHLERNGEAYYRQACRKGWEGIIGKKADSPYISRRSPDWLKFKCINEQEFVVGGYTDPVGTRIAFGALLVGYYENGRLVYAGKVGTGYDMTTLRSLQTQLNKLEISQSPFTADGLPIKGVHWVKPKLVVQLGFAEWTAAGKLRQPRFLGVRNDKRPEDVLRERAAA